MRRAVFLVALVACRAETVAPAQKPADPPVTSESAIPDAPVSGTIHGTPFVARDARFIADDRVGYEHVDIALSAGKSKDACGAIDPERATSVWLRLDGKHSIDPKDAASYTVHYQVFDGDHWLGLTAQKALVVLRPPSPDGRLSGGLAVCFGDEWQSCVSGSFDAASCPPEIDAPVRGRPPPESVPKEYLEKWERK